MFLRRRSEIKTIKKGADIAPPGVARNVILPKNIIGKVIAKGFFATFFPQKIVGNIFFVSFLLKRKEFFATLF